MRIEPMPAYCPSCKKSYCVERERAKSEITCACGGIMVGRASTPETTDTIAGIEREQWKD